MNRDQYLAKLADNKARLLQHRVEWLLTALQDLVARCDGDEGVRADGSNIDTLAAHAALMRDEAITQGDPYRDQEVV